MALLVRRKLGRVFAATAVQILDNSLWMSKTELGDAPIAFAKKCSSWKKCLCSEIGRIRAPAGAFVHSQAHSCAHRRIRALTGAFFRSQAHSRAHRRIRALTGAFVRSQADRRIRALAGAFVPWFYRVDHGSTGFLRVINHAFLPEDSAATVEGQ